MRRRKVIFRAGAARYLAQIFRYIAAAVGTDIAQAYIRRLHDHCLKLSHASERGTLRPGVRRGLRTIGFERRATIAFLVRDQAVEIVSIAYGGRNWERELS